MIFSPWWRSRGCNSAGRNSRRDFNLASALAEGDLDSEEAAATLLLADDELLVVSSLNLVRFGDVVRWLMMGRVNLCWWSCTVGKELRFVTIRAWFEPKMSEVWLSKDVWLHERLLAIVIVVDDCRSMCFALQRVRKCRCAVEWFWYDDPPTQIWIGHDLF